MSIKDTIKRLVGERSSNRYFVASQASGLYTIRVLYKVINFVLAILLAHWLGQNTFGIYTLAWTWASLLVIPGSMGLERMTVREVARAQIAQNWGRIRGYLEWSLKRSLLSSGIITVLMIFASLVIYRDQPDTRAAFLAATLLIPVTVLTRRMQSTHDGLKNMTQGRMPDMIIQPLIFMACVAALHWGKPSWLTAATALALYALTTFIFSLGIGVWFLRGVYPPQARTATPEVDANQWTRSSLVFLAISIIFVADSRTSTLMLGALAAKTDVAIYGVLTRVVDILTFILAAFATPVSRLGIQYYQEGQKVKLQRLLTRSVWIMTLAGAPLAILLIIFGKLYLNIFGPEYLPGYPGLILLTMAEIVNLATGLSSFLLTLTTHEKVAAWITLTGLAFNFLIGFLLIPRLGLVGAAVAEMSSVIIRNVALSYATYKLMGVNTTILSLPPIGPWKKAA